MAAFRMPLQYRHEQIVFQDPCTQSRVEMPPYPEFNGNQYFQQQFRPTTYEDTSNLQLPTGLRLPARNDRQAFSTAIPQAIGEDFSDSRKILNFSKEVSVVEKSSSASFPTTTTSEETSSYSRQRSRIRHIFPKRIQRSSLLLKTPSLKQTPVMMLCLAFMLVLCSGAFLLYHIMWSTRLHSNWITFRRTKLEQNGPHQYAPSQELIDFTKEISNSPRILENGNSDRSGPQAVMSLTKGLGYETTEILDYKEERVDINSIPRYKSTRKKQMFKGRPCQSSFCQQQKNYFKSFLNWSSNPCRDFYHFVCSPELANAHEEYRYFNLKQLLTERKLFQILDEEAVSKTAHKNKPLHLLHLCNKDIGLLEATGQLKKALSDIGLRSWPLTNNQERIDVWKVAALLIRHFNLPTLISVGIEKFSETSEGYLIAIDEPDIIMTEHNTLGINSLPSWYIQALSQCFSLFRPTYLQEIVKGVEELSKRLIGTVRYHPAFRAGGYKISSLERYSVYHRFISYVFQGTLYIKKESMILVKTEQYFEDLMLILQSTRSTDALNYMGFRLLIHLSPFLSKEFKLFSDIRMNSISGQGEETKWPRWRRCLRLLEPIMPAIYLQSYAKLLRGKAAARSRIALIASDVKSSLSFSLNNLSWMDDRDKTKSRNILESLQIHIFFPMWALRPLEQVPFTSFSEVPSERLLSSFREFTRRSVMHRFSCAMHYKRNIEDDWQGSVFDKTPTFDYRTKTVYLPVGSVDLLDFNDASFSLQVPRLATGLAESIFQALHKESYPFDSLQWATSTNSSLKHVQRCLAQWYYKDSKNSKGGRETIYRIVDNLVIKPAYEVYLKYLKTHSVDLWDTGMLLEKGIDARHLFFILLASYRCNSQGILHQEKVPLDNYYEQQKHRVNVPVKHSKSFSELFKCQREPGAASKDCNMWNKS